MCSYLWDDADFEEFNTSASPANWASDSCAASSLSASCGSLSPPAHKPKRVIRQRRVPVVAPHHYSVDLTAKVDEKLKGLRRVNSTGTLYVSDSISVPNDDLTIKCVSHVLNEHIVSSRGRCNPAEYQDFNLNCDQLAVCSADPASIDAIYQFISAIFINCQLSSQCHIVALIYIERLMEMCGIYLTDLNWRHIVLAAFMLASKVWDDLSMINDDFAFICSLFSLDQINQLEIRFLDCLQYDLNISRQQYTEYYFRVRDVCRLKIAGVELPLQQLTVERATQLEIRSSLLASEYNMAWRRTRTRSLTMDDMPLSTLPITPSSSCASLLLS